MLLHSLAKLLSSFTKVLLSLEKIWKIFSPIFLQPHIISITKVLVLKAKF